MITKECTKCKKVKSIDLFSFIYGRKKKDGTRKGRYNSQCKICRTILLKRWRDNNPEKAKISSENWIKNNLQKNKETRKKYKVKNKELVIKWKRDWDLKNRDRYKIYNSKQSKENKSLWQNITKKRLTAKLADCYIISILCANNNLKASDIREKPELIEQKREIIKVHRLIRKINNYDTSK